MLRMLIDCDTGIDDSLALLYALKHPEVKVEGIISSFGNTSADQAAENSIRLIKLAKPGYEIPVTIGASRPLVGDYDGPYPHIHGRNGIGDVELPKSEQTPLAEDGVDFIIRMARDNPGELTLVTLGRLTDVALALQKEPLLPKLIKNIVAMGSTLYHPGHDLPNSDANISGDPEAADAVMLAGFDLTMVGLDVTGKTHFTAQRLECLQKYAKEENRHIVNYIGSAMDFYYNFNRVANNCLDYCPVHDPLTMVVAVNPGLALYRKLRARIECGGTFSRGRTVIDTREYPFDAPFTTFCVDVDATKAIEEFVAAFTHREWFANELI